MSETVTRAMQLVQAASNDHVDADGRLHAELCAFVALDRPTFKGGVIAEVAVFASWALRRLANALEVHPDELIDEYVRIRRGDDPGDVQR